MNEPVENINPLVFLITPWFTNALALVLRSDEPDKVFSERRGISIRFVPVPTRQQTHIYSQSSSVDFINFHLLCRRVLTCSWSDMNIELARSIIFLIGLSQFKVLGHFFPLIKSHVGVIGTRRVKKQNFGHTKWSCNFGPAVNASIKKLWINRTAMR